MKICCFVILALVLVSWTLSQETPAWKKRIEDLKAYAAANMTQEQKTNFATLKKDLEAILAKSEVTPEQKQKLVEDLLKCLSTATKPDKAQVEKLIMDLLKVCSDKKISTSEIMLITQDIQAVLVSANISEADANALIKDVQAILKASNVTKADIDKIVADIKAIIKTAQAQAATKPS